jgi:hypothetical protein
VDVPKIGVSLDDAAAEQAEAEGVRLSCTALHEARVAAGLHAVAEWEAENGPLTEEELAWANDVLGHPGPPQQAD